MMYEDKERQDFIFTIHHWWQALAIFTVYLWSGLPMKVSVAGCVAIPVVLPSWLHHLQGSLGSGGAQSTLTPCFPLLQAKLSIMLLTLAVAVGSYLWMEHKLAQHMAYRLPRIPRPRHKMRGYRYLEEDNSDETGSEGEGSKENDDEHPAEATSGDELPKDDGEQLG